MRYHCATRTCNVSHLDYSENFFSFYKEQEVFFFGELTVEKTKNVTYLSLSWIFLELKWLVVSEFVHKSHKRNQNTYEKKKPSEVGLEPTTSRLEV